VPLTYWMHAQIVRRSLRQVLAETSTVPMVAMPPPTPAPQQSEGVIRYLMLSQQRRHLPPEQLFVHMDTAHTAASSPGRSYAFPLTHLLTTEPQALHRGAAQASSFLRTELPGWLENALSPDAAAFLYMSWAVYEETGYTISLRTFDNDLSVGSSLVRRLTFRTDRAIAARQARVIYDSELSVLNTSQGRTPTWPAITSGCHRLHLHFRAHLLNLLIDDSTERALRICATWAKDGVMDTKPAAPWLQPPGRIPLRIEPTATGAQFFADGTAIAGLLPPLPPLDPARSPHPLIDPQITTFTWDQAQRTLSGP